jgi:hypothetical protein
MRALVAALALLPTLAFAQAPPPTPEGAIGRVVSGYQIYLKDNGSIDVSFTPPIVVEDGRVFVQQDGKWHEVVPTPPVASENVAPVDWVAYSGLYVGRRIAVAGVRFLDADVQYSRVELPGASAIVDLSGVPPEMLKYVITNCTSVFTGPECMFDIVGIAGRKDARNLWMNHISLSRSAAPKTISDPP